MSFKFMHSKIDTRTSVPSLSEIVRRAQTKKAMAVGQTKTASSKFAKGEPDFVKKMKDKGEESEEKEEKEGESEEEDGWGGKKKPFPGAAAPFKSKGKKASTNRVAEKEEGETSGQLESKANPNNDPKMPEGSKDSKGGHKKNNEDEGESSGQLDVEPLHQEGESTGKKPAGLETMKGKEGTSDKKAAVKNNSRFMLVAELTDKQKAFVKATWSVYWPKSFIDAILNAK